MSNQKETILDVDGMTCSSCVRHVEHALAGLDGIDKVEVNLKDGRVRVEQSSARTTVDQMIEALGEAGYGARPAGRSSGFGV